MNRNTDMSTRKDPRGCEKMVRVRVQQKHGRSLEKRERKKMAA